MQDRVEGTILPVLVVDLEPGDSVISEAGEFSWMSGSIEMSTSTGGGTGGKGLMGAVKRAAGGSSFLFNSYTAKGGPGSISFATKLPGGIFPIDVAKGSNYFAHRHGFLAGTPGIQISAGFQQSFRGGVFGGEGFILQKVGGEGRAWIELSGEIVARELADGESMKVHPGHVGLFDASVKFEVVRVQGMANRYLGSDGHHFVLLTGPGRVWLQSMPISILAGALAPYLAKDDGSHPVESGAVGGAVAGVIGGLLGNK
jgi:uncharacterized protein (TIGR00266 family)